MSAGQQFASDNNAGICPEALAALVSVNSAGHAPGYGEDRWTAAAIERVRETFETRCEVFFVFNGTAANALALAALCRPYHAVLAHRLSHIESDEASAPAFFSGGAKLIPLDGAMGKLSPLDIEAQVADARSVHHSKPRAVSLTQATEVGTVYSPSELRAISDAARRNGLHVHMDGARFANAVASLGLAPADLSWRTGVDVLSLGGTKNGLAVGEAVIFFHAGLAEEFAWRVKQSGQLASKLRFITAPWSALLESGAWLAHARHANRMARRLADAVAGLAGVKLLFPVEANGVFLDLSLGLQAALRGAGWRFYTFLGETGCRFMCAWDTAPETVDRLAADLTAAIAAPASARGARR